MMCNHIVKVDLYSTKKAGSNIKWDMLMNWTWIVWILLNIVYCLISQTDGKSSGQKIFVKKDL